MNGRFYVSILNGEDARSAEPVIATCDQIIVDAVLEIIARRLGVVGGQRVLRLEDARRQDPREGER